MSHKLKFIIIISLQVIALFGMIGIKQYPLLAGKRVTLKVLPIDPRSLMSGDYVALRYDISSPDWSKQAHATDVYGMKEVYAKVRRGPDGTYSPAGYYFEKPETGPDEAILKGKVNNIGASYGIETFFVEEGKGHVIEKKTREGQVYAVVAVTSGGRAALDTLLVGGKPFE
jgi:uncharacterized membrane-anchored protein